MVADTKMFIAIKKEAILEIMPLIIDSINKWQRNKLDAYYKSENFDSRLNFIFRDIVME
jgi:hypothetical protein